MPCAARDLKSAEAAYREALRLEPTLAAAEHGLGVLALQAGQYRQAAEQFARTLALEPNNESAQHNAALALENCGRIEPARAIYRRLSQAAPADELLRLHAETLSPMFPRDNAEIDAYRAGCSKWSTSIRRAGCGYRCVKCRSPVVMRRFPGYSRAATIVS